MAQQHTNVEPLSAEQRAEFAAAMRRLASVEAQAGTRDPAEAAAMAAWVADRYEQEAV